MRGLWRAQGFDPETGEPRQPVEIESWPYHELLLEKVRQGLVYLASPGASRTDAAGLHPAPSMRCVLLLLLQGFTQHHTRR